MQLFILTDYAPTNRLYDCKTGVPSSYIRCGNNNIGLLFQVTLTFEEIIERRMTGRRMSKHTLGTYKSANTMNSMGAPDSLRTFELFDYLTPGMAFGELCTLTGETFNFRMVCESSVQVCSYTVYILLTAFCSGCSVSSPHVAECRFFKDSPVVGIF